MDRLNRCNALVDDVVRVFRSALLSCGGKSSEVMQRLDRLSRDLLEQWMLTLPTGTAVCSITLLNDVPAPSGGLFRQATGGSGGDGVSGSRILLSRLEAGRLPLMVVLPAGAGAGAGAGQGGGTTASVDSPSSADVPLLTALGSIMQQSAESMQGTSGAASSSSGDGGRAQKVEWWQVRGSIDHVCPCHGSLLVRLCRFHACSLHGSRYPPSPPPKIHSPASRWIVAWRRSSPSSAQTP